MKVEIKDDVLVVEAESEAETLLLKEWRENWHKAPKAEKWFEVHYFRPNPSPTVPIGVPERP